MFLFQLCVKGIPQRLQDGILGSNSRSQAGEERERGKTKRRKIEIRVQEFELFVSSFVCTLAV